MRVLLKPPTTDPTTTYPPTYINTEGQILTMFCILQFLKTVILIYFIENFNTYLNRILTLIRPGFLRVVFEKDVA